MAVKIKNAYTVSERVVTENKGPTLTKQEFKKDTDLNVIMRKFQVTGALDHVTMHSGNYGDASPLDYHQAKTIIANANSMFEDLPSNIRNRFDNQPEKFLEFVQTESNYDEAKELGIQLAPELQDKVEAERAAAAQQASSETASTETVETTTEQPV
jgi:phage internal scaffolding protein